MVLTWLRKLGARVSITHWWEGATTSRTTLGIDVLLENTTAKIIADVHLQEEEMTNCGLRWQTADRVIGVYVPFSAELWMLWICRDEEENYSIFSITSGVFFTTS